MKRILYVVTSVDTSGGLMSILAKKINFLSKNGFDIAVYSVNKHVKLFYSLPKNVTIVSSPSSSNFRGIICSFINYIKKNRFDIIISADASYIQWLLPFITRTPIISEIHQSYDGLVDFYKNSKFPKLNLLIHKIAYSITFSQYRKIVVLTEEDKRKWKWKNVIVIPNFHTISNDIKLKPTKKKIISIGRFQYQKGYDLLIGIWKKVSLLFPGWELHYYGTEKDKFTLSELRRLKAPDSFKIMGITNNLDEIYSGAYLNIVPSRSEGFSLVIIEGMCYGIPSVSYSLTGPKSIVSNGIDGVLIDNLSIDRAADAIIDLINNPCKRNILSQNCSLQSAKYTEDRIMQKWIDLFNSLSTQD